MVGTKTPPRAAKSTRTATNGHKTAKPAPKRPAPKTAAEALLIAWQHDYETRHGRTKKRA